MIPVSEALSLVSYTPEEESQIAKLEASIDLYMREHFDGGALRLSFKQDITPKIAAAIQRKYEETSGWRVSVAPDPRRPYVITFSFVPLFFNAVMTKSKIVTKLPAIASSSIALAKSNPASRILVRMPTRNRPKQALEVLQKYRDMAGEPLLLEVVIDEDDTTMMDPLVLQRLCALGCIITVGKHGSKIEACNGGRFYEWDILVLASDDMVPVQDGYALRILTEMNRHWPFRDGAIFFDDGYAGERCATMSIMGRRLWDRFGYVYHPDYSSLFCDNEYTEVLRTLKRLVYIDDKIIEHRHPATGLVAKDKLYEHNDALWDRDKVIFESRKARGFDLTDIRLSICIATLPSRIAKLDRLVQELYTQIDNAGPGLVEIVIDDRVDITIGEKRQALLERAVGSYVSFIDDDDWISCDYVERILNALYEKPDCVSLHGIMTTAGDVPEHFHCSIVNREWKKEGDVHLRCPNHLNPIRRDLALQVGFTAVNHAEDFHYSMGLLPLLQVEHATSDAPLYYYWFDPTKGGVEK